jgi:hypothetical protein
LSPTAANKAGVLFRSLKSGVDAIGPKTRTALSYAVAGAILWFVAQGINPARIALSLRRADAGLFLSVCAVSFAVWFLGETLLFSRLFSYFHRRTTFYEMLVPNAAQYFLQVVNVAVGSGALLFFLNRRKGVPWLAGGATLLLQALVDLQILALMALAGLTVSGHVRFPGALYYLVGMLAAMWLIMWFWLRGRPRWRIARMIYDRRVFRSFREARLSHYLRLIALRAPIFIFQSFVFYGEMRAFAIHAPIATVMADTPLILLATSLPLTPVGIGSEQLMMVWCFRAYASVADLLAVSLAISATGVLFRCALGIGSVRSFIHQMLAQDLSGEQVSAPASVAPKRTGALAPDAP